MSSKNLPFKVGASRTFQKKMEVPTSKSHANRALIVGAIKGSSFQVHLVPDSSDVVNLLNCLRAIGLRIAQNGSTVEFLNSFPSCEEDNDQQVIDLVTGDGGTTNRFLIALLSLGKKTYRLFPSERMSERPIADLIGPLKSLGVNIKHHAHDGGPWLSIQGPVELKTKSLDVECAQSTQFASALMLAFSVLPVTFNFLNLKASSSYVQLTAEVLRKTAKQDAYTVPVDFSSLGYPLVLAALYGELTVSNCHERDAFQADSVLLELIKRSGALVEFRAEGLYVARDKNLRPFCVKVQDCPDLFPTLAFLAAHIHGESIFTDLEILRYKESDRLKETINLLKAFNVSYTLAQDESSLRIQGLPAPNYPYQNVRPPRDHRIVMAAYLFMRANNGGELFEADCVEKSFPHFFTQLE